MFKLNFSRKKKISFQLTGLVIIWVFFFHFKKSSWDIVDLQGCDNFFSQQSDSVTHIYTYILSDSFPTWIITEYWVEFFGYIASPFWQTFHIFQCAYANPKSPVHPPPHPQPVPFNTQKFFSLWVISVLQISSHVSFF